MILVAYLILKVNATLMVRKITIILRRMIKKKDNLYNRKIIIHF